MSEDLWIDAVRRAEHLCPTELPHLDKIRWKAAHIREALAGQQGEARPAREEREAFEAWAKPSVALDLHRWDGSGNYSMTATVYAFAAWQARAALATQAAPEAPPLSSAAPDNNAPAPMALSSEARTDKDSLTVDAGERDTLRARILAILDGIDREETDRNGWWETSTAADFGAKVLARIDAALADGGAK